MEEKRSFIETDLLTPRVPINNDKMYSFEGFLSSMKVFADGTVQGIYFYVGHDSSTVNRKRGLVNVAAFLAHVKTIAIYNSMCDERNIDGIDDKYPISNSCGQFGQLYQNLRCPSGEVFMECPPDPGLQMTAIAPLQSEDNQDSDENNFPEFFCGPRRYFPFTGHFERKSNTVNNEQAFTSRAGRSDVEGCCWWGRGAGQVKGVCMYGKLNYYIGARAKEEGRRSLFPNVDFCKNPQEICSGLYSYSLMWVTGMFAWVDLVQPHSDYHLDKVVDGDMRGEMFVDLVSDILGHNDRDRISMRANFKLALQALGITTISVKLD
jgi:hypothetical protein